MCHETCVCVKRPACVSRDLRVCHETFVCVMRPATCKLVDDRLSAVLVDSVEGFISGIHS